MDEKRKMLQEMKNDAEREMQKIQGELKPLMLKARKLHEKIDLIQRLMEVDITGDRLRVNIRHVEGEFVSGEDARKKFIEILKSHPKGLHYREIYKELENLGFRMKGKEPAFNLIAHMSNDLRKRFESLGKGVWRLNENLLKIK